VYLYSAGHDCREEVMQEHTDPGLWEAHILASGLSKTYDSLAGLHDKDRNPSGGKSRYIRLGETISRKGYLVNVILP
jgi:hypothetical protein